MTKRHPKCQNAVARDTSQKTTLVTQAASLNYSSLDGTSLTPRKLISP